MTTLGILGGGALARLLTQAAQNMGVNVAVLDRDENSPAAQVTAYGVQGDWYDLDLVAEFAQACDVITVESGAVPTAVLAHLEALGKVVRPSSKTLAIAGDRFEFKQALRAAGLPVAPHAAVETADDLRAFGAAHGYPLMLKTRTGGHDNSGNAMLPGPAAADAVFAALSAQGRPLMVEAMRQFARELSIVAARGQDGALKCYPASDIRLFKGVVQCVNTPAPDTYATIRAAKGRLDGAYYFDQLEALVSKVAEAIDIIGAFSLELFEQSNGQLLVNSIAPHPSFAGVYSLDACNVSVYENHARAVLGQPLGWTDTVAPHAATVTLFARNDALPSAQDFSRAMQFRGARLHWYGKASATTGRVLGHVTALHETDPEAERIVQMYAATLIGW